MILVVAESAHGKSHPATAGLVALAQRLAADLEQPVGLAIIGAAAASLSPAWSAWKLDRVIEAAHPALDSYSPTLYAAALEQLIEKEAPAMVLAAHTSFGSDFIPRVAARLQRPLVSGCTGYEKQGDRLLLTRPVYNAKLSMRIRLQGPGPYFALVAPTAFPDDGPAPRDGGEASPVETFTPALDGVEARWRLIERVAAAQAAVDLGAASIIVSAGRGLNKKENLGIVQDLADALGAAVGASRPVVDAEWLPRDRQIGSSGQTVSPQLYFAIGISGAVQHLVGMQSSRCIVAINKDPDAPIFKVAHYGIVDDLFKVTPEITRIIRQLRAQ